MPLRYADRWSSGGPAEERHGISLSELLVMVLEAARVICASVNAEFASPLAQVDRRLRWFLTGQPHLS